MRSELETTLRTIFRRCVKCPQETPTCPVCPAGKICSQIIEDCGNCARTECVPDSPGSGRSSSGGGGTNPGIIAGGVVGGIFVVALITFLVWKYLLKGRRRESQQFNWDESEEVVEKEPSEFTMRRDARASTHTVASLASTVLTRASNIIQIAYIPGVTNRGGPTSPDLLVPPVPPIPAQVSPTSPHSNLYSPSVGDHFFLAEDIRDSTYSGFADRSEYARSSVAPSLARGSVASTVYRSNAVVGPQAQTIVRGKAAMVSVRPGGSGENSPYDFGSDTPPMPSLPGVQHFGEHHIPPSHDSTRSPDYQASSHSKADGLAVRTAQVGKPVPLNITKKPSGSSLTSTPTLIMPYSPVSEAETDANGTTNPAIQAAIVAASSTRPLLDSSPRSATAPSPAARSPLPRLRLFPSPSPSPHPAHDDGEDETSPFADSPRSCGSPKKGQPALESVIEEAFRRGSSMDSRADKKPDGRSASPFGDENEVAESRSGSQ